MSIVQRFLAYAGAFEETYVDDDWSRLEPFFSEDTVYRSSGGPPLGGHWEGRQAVVGQLRASVDGLDRRFDRRSVELLGDPALDGETLSIKWRATYEREGCPNLVFDGAERATFAGETIRLLEDEIEEGADLRIQTYLARYFEDGV